MADCKKVSLDIVNNTEGAILFRQFEDLNNPYAHYINTAREIYNKFTPDYFFAGIGTGGTISGVGKFFKENNLSTKIIGVEPFESPLLTEGHAHPHLIQGIGANFIPDTLDRSVIDEITTVKGEEAINMAKLIRSDENIDCGYSSGAALLAAINYLNANNITGKKVVVIFPDKGDRYQW